MNESQPLLAVRDLAVSFAGSDGRSRPAVRSVSFTVYPAQTVAVVGESGSGKSVTALSLLRLLPRNSASIDGGSAVFSAAAGAIDLLSLSDRDIRAVRGGEVAMIFQEPMTSLNPVFTVGEQIIETVMLHQRMGRRQARVMAVEALRGVGIADPERRLDDYPHQFSGGMRQRVMIAIALACRSRLLIADEPTTALDTTIQAQILGLLRSLREKRGLAILLISHDLGVVAENADVVCVMYAGRVVEYASAGAVFNQPLHPYTRGLLQCVPRLDQPVARLWTVRQVVEDPSQWTAALFDRHGLRAWWPGHPPPEGTMMGSTGVDSELVEIEPGHWAAVWRTPACFTLSVKQPDLSTGRREPAATASRIG